MLTSLGIAPKLFIVCAAFGLPIAVMSTLLTRASLREVEFGSKEIAGDAYLRPLETTLAHLSRHRRLWSRYKHGESSLAAEVQNEQAAIDRAIEAVSAVDARLGAELQFTPDGLALRKRQPFTAAQLSRKWQAHRAQLDVMDASTAQAGYTDLIAHVRAMITHAGDCSNLILDPDLDTYYLMDVTLLALPQMQDRVQALAYEVDTLVAARALGDSERVHIATQAAFLSEVDVDRILVSTRTALNEDPNFYGISPSLQQRLPPRLAQVATTSERVIARLRNLLAQQGMESFDAEAFRSDIERLHDALFDFQAEAFDEEDTMLRTRIATFESRLQWGLGLAALALLVAAVLAYTMASDIIRRVRRISAATEAFASGRMEARVGSAGRDELGLLARSFDSMTDQIGALNAEIQMRANQLADANAGLEQTVKARTAELTSRNEAFRLILDNVREGLLIVDLQGAISSERSAIIDRWFGEPSPDATIFSYIARHDAELAAGFKLGLDAIIEDFMPLELTLDQMPQQMELGSQHFRLSYQPIFAEGKVSRVLMMITDVTSEIAGRLAAAKQEEVMRIFQACQRDRPGFLNFFIDTRELVNMCGGERRSAAEVKRLVHTIKGNCALFGVLSVATLCHDIENVMAENGGILEEEQAERLRRGWSELSATVAQIVGEHAADKIELGDEEYASIVDAVARGVPRRNLLQAIAQWKLEPTERRLKRIAQPAEAVARRLGKDVVVRVEANDVRLCAETFSQVWSTLVHALRNAVDHGIEPAPERIAKGKPPAGEVVLRTRIARGSVVIEIADDGRGINWSAVEAKARAAHLPFATKQDLVDAVFADGLSTRDEVSDTSGRGVGMGAIREACEQIGGKVELESEPGKGTLLRCSFPEELTGGTTVASVVAREISRSLAPLPAA
jgi:HAMP domain-containing protein/HPt (histidine-containing phosphotransfer) domain-containing protein/two-component sensor histidine kinase